MFFRGIWKGPGVFNVEHFPSKPFLDDVAERGLPTTIIDIGPGDQDELFEVVT
jgi:saccharopine dehydrogenase (NAD+, L-lysine-forming)